MTFDRKVLVFMSVTGSHNIIFEVEEEPQPSSSLLPQSTLYLFLSLYLLLLAFFIVLVSGMNFDEQRVSDALNSLEQSFSSSEETLPWRNRSDEVYGSDIVGQKAMFDRVNSALGEYLAHIESVENETHGQLSIFLRSTEIFDDAGQMTGEGIYSLDAFGDELIRSEREAIRADDLVIKADIIYYYERGGEEKAIEDVSRIVERLEDIGTPANRLTIAIEPLMGNDLARHIGLNRSLSALDNLQIMIGFEPKEPESVNMIGAVR